MPNADLKLSCSGSDAIAKRLAQIDQRVCRKAIDKAVRAASKPVLDAAKANVPVDSGLLKKSLGRKVKGYKGGLIIVAIIGPRTGFRNRKKGLRWKQLVKRKGRQKERLANPAKYAHLVEFGTRRSRARPFLRPAFDSQKGVIETVMLSTLRNALAAAAR